MKIRYVREPLCVQFTFYIYLQHEHNKPFTDEDESHVTNSHQSAYHPDGNVRTDNVKNMDASAMGSAAAMQVSANDTHPNGVVAHV
jgi:hypothetical protein